MDPTNNDGPDMPEAPEFEGDKVFEKILAVMHDVPTIEKDGFNDFAGFKFAKIDTIRETLQPIFVKHKLAVIPDILDEHRDGNLATVSMLVTFVNMENPSDRFTTRWTGTGTDKGDKAIPKAITAAYKACVINTFCIGTGENDPDSESQAHEVRKLSDDEIREVIRLLDEKNLDAKSILDAIGETSLSDVPANQFARIKRSIAAAKAK